MKCLRCQQENPPQAKFCLECGAAIGAIRPPLKSSPATGAEIEGLRRSLSEALEQQTATSEILRVIASSATDVHPVFDAVVENAVRLCGGNFGAVYRCDGERIHLAATHNISGEALKYLRRLAPRPPGRVVLERRVIQIADLETDPDVPEDMQIGARLRQSRSDVSVPLMRGERCCGYIVIGKREPGHFPDRQIELLKTFADQAVIAIENVRLFTELQEKNRALSEAHAQVTESLERQTATADILRTIGASPTDVQPVFEAIARSCVQLGQGVFGGVFRFDGALIHLEAQHNWSPEALERYRRTFPRPPGTDNVITRTILAGCVVHVPDIEAEASLPLSQSLSRTVGYRSALSVPMLRDGRAVGAIAVARPEPGGFSDKQIALLQTFADQAVIAIENVRLFTEPQEKSRALTQAHAQVTEALEQRTATSEILRVISQSPADVQPVFDAIVRRASHLCDLSKVEAGRMELELTDFHLPTALDDALTLVRERAGRRGIALHMTTDERIEYVRADERKRKQVLLNLLSNAIKFTPNGGRIEVQAKPVDGAVGVSVRDTGVGIAPGDPEAIFEEFRQVGTADKKVEGTGLGLALSRKFVELHGGRIWVESQVGVGSTFTFTIPLGHDLR